MKLAKIIIKSAVIFIVTAIMALSVSAYTISFTVFEEKEQKYIYDDLGSNNSNGSRFCDATTYIIYEFPVQTTDKYVSLSWSIANQYAVYVCTSDPDDSDNWKPIYFLEKPEGDVGLDWAPFDLKNVTHDLSKYAPLCKEGKIWIIMGDSDPKGGWGGYISNSEPVVYKTSQSTAVVGAVAEYVAPVTEPVTTELITEVTTVDVMADYDEFAAKRIDPITYRQPVMGIVGGVIALAVFIALFFIRRAF